MNSARTREWDIHHYRQVYPFDCAQSLSVERNGVIAQAQNPLWAMPRGPGKRCRDAFNRLRNFETDMTGFLKFLDWFLPVSGSWTNGEVDGNTLRAHDIVLLDSIIIEGSRLD